MSRLAAVLALAVVLTVFGSAPVPAQAPAPARLGTPLTPLVRDSLVPGQRVPSGTDQERQYTPATYVNVHPHFVFTPVSGPAKEVDGLRKTQTLEGFDAAKRGFRSLRFVFDRTMAAEGYRDPRTSNSTLQLTVGLLGGTAGDRWFRMAPAPASAGDPDREELPPTEDKPLETAALATPDPSLPIVIVAFGSSAWGANTHTETDSQLLLDFRGPVPRAVAWLEHVVSEGGGACGAYDLEFAVNSTLDCRWDAAQADFLCRERVHRADAVWGSRQASRYFYLDSGAPYWPSLAPPTSPDLVSLAEAWAAANQAPPTTTIEALGRVTALAEVPSSRLGVRMFLFGGESTSGALDARFFLARVARAATTTVREIRVGTRIGSGEDDPYSAERPPLDAEFVRDGGQTTFRAHLLSRRGSLRVVSVVVREMKGSALYWVGVEDSASPVADALLVSTDAPFYDHCNLWIRPTAAARFTLVPGPFRARLDTEPAHVQEGTNGTLSDRNNPEDSARFPACPYTLTVRWVPMEGFDVEGQPRACEWVTPRIPVINDDGTLSSRPADGFSRPAPAGPERRPGASRRERN